jgi:cell wall-associated NlpC family hydrolase
LNFQARFFEFTIENNYNFTNNMLKSILSVSLWIVLMGFLPHNTYSQVKAKSDTTKVRLSSTVILDTLKRENSSQVDQIISFAKTLLGIPYRYAGNSPTGFDCSGFINYVMGNFGVKLTRTSYGLAEFGETVRLSELKPGDLMYFTGRNPRSKTVGHVGLVVEVSPNTILFIHSSSSRGVVIENFITSQYFLPRYLKSKRLDYGGYK